MPATFTRTPIDTDRKNPGIGGKPPVDQRPTGGGGDGDNWDNRPPGRRGPRALLRRYRLVLFFALAGDLMFFMPLVTALFLRQGSGRLDVRNHFISDWHPLAIPPLLWLNTALLVLSSVAIEVGRRQLFHEIDVMEEWLGLGRPAVRRATPWLIATVFLGSAFLGGQWLAWKQLYAEGVFFATNPTSDIFYLITGIHGIHLFLGLLALGAALTAMFLFKRVEYRQIAVDCSAWYWHTMGIFWIFLFGMLVYFQ